MARSQSSEDHCFAVIRANNSDLFEPPEVHSWTGNKISDALENFDYQLAELIWLQSEKNQETFSDIINYLKEKYDLHSTDESS